MGPPWLSLLWGMAHPCGVWKRRNFIGIVAIAIDVVVVVDADQVAQNGTRGDVKVVLEAVIVAVEVRRAVARRGRGGDPA